MFFNDYQYKDLSIKVHLKILREVDTPFTPWQFSNFISSFNTYYYKFELIDTIAMALNKGINPENIFILDKSFESGFTYSKFDVLNLNKNGIYDIYKIGKPISLLPNDKIYEIYFAFKVAQEVSEILKKSHQKKRFHSDLIKTLINNYSSVSFINDAEEEVLSSGLVEDKIRQLLSNRFNQLRNEYRGYLNNKHVIKSIKGVITYNGLPKDIDKNTRDIIDKYFNKFFNSFSRVSRPVIGIYYVELEKVKILCNAHINKKRMNNTVLELASLTHKSPHLLEFIGGVFLPKLVDVVINKDRRKLEEDLLKEKINTEKLKQNTEKLKQIERKLNIIKNLSMLNDDVVPYNVRDVYIQYIKNQLSIAESKLEEQTVRLMKNNQFEIENEIIEGIDRKV